jgi:hypothetical protein
MPDDQASPHSAHSPLKLAASYEAGIWRSLYRWLTRRRGATDPDAALFGYASQATPLLLPFIFLSALEIPILPLLLPRPAVRYSLLGLGAWALLWTLGLLASLRTNPHVLSAVALRLRSGFQLDASIPLGSRSPPSDTAAQAHSGSSRSRTTEPAHRSPSKARATSRSSSENQSLSASSTAGRQTSTPSTSTQTAQPHL